MTRSTRMGTTVTVSELPDCDLPVHSGRKPKARYDARMLRAYGGQWAYMCAVCWRTYSLRVLGMGLGQRLVTSNQSRAQRRSRA